MFGAIRGEETNLDNVCVCVGGGGTMDVTRSCILCVLACTFRLPMKYKIMTVACVSVDFVTNPQSSIDKQRVAVVSSSALCCYSVYLVLGFSVQSNRIGKN